MRKIMTPIAILLSAVALSAAPDKQEQQDERSALVRVTEPTVLTVRESDQTDAERQECRRGRKAKRAAAAASAGAGRFAGWLLNAGEDIPSPRERNGFRGDRR